MKSQEFSFIDEYKETLEDRELIEEIDQNYKRILELTKEGKCRDLGGFVAMRGFVYQYYITIYYILEMIYGKRSIWWDKVIVEFHDDIALMSKDKIRFIQVKTKKEEKKFSAGDFVSRDKKKKDDIKKFNSWIDKIFLNYEYFKEEFLEHSTINEISKYEYKYEFEFVINAPISGKKLDDYIENTNFNIETINSDDFLKEKLLDPKGNNHDTIQTYLSDDLDCYLKKFYINKMGHFDSLEKDLINMIKEILGLNKISSSSIAEEVLNKLFLDVLNRCKKDNLDYIDKEKLIISKDYIEKKLSIWASQSMELLSKEVIEETAYSIFSDTYGIIENEIKSEYTNEFIKREMILSLNDFKKYIEDEFANNPSYCVEFIDKLFTVSCIITHREYNSHSLKEHVKESVKYLITFFGMYEDSEAILKELDLLIHEGKSNILGNNRLSILHGQGNYEKGEIQARIEIMYNDSISMVYREPIYIMILGEKQGLQKETLFSDNSISTESILYTDNKYKDSITNVSKNLKYIDSEEYKKLIDTLKVTANLNSIKDDKFLYKWKDEFEKLI